ncbi:MAG TPA: hypothetical protein VHG92_11730 [Afifellaceae bacterium]|nr:hypothetical protein [Afifellaceae bacterium]
MTITKSITIYCDGVIGGVLATGTNGIVVNAGATDVVVLRGLDIEGAGTGLNGIRFLAGAALHVQESLIRNFQATAPNGNGIMFVPSTANAELYVTDTIISQNGTAIASTGVNQGAIQVEPTGSGSAKVVLSRVRIANNHSNGFRANSTGGSTTIIATITDSTIVGNGVHGVLTSAPVANGPVQLMIDGSTLSNNSSAGIRTNGSSATIRISNTNISGNAMGSQATNGAIFQSYGTNRIDGNTNDGPNPVIIPQK